MRNGIETLEFIYSGFAVALVLGVITGIYLFVNGFIMRRRRRQMKNIPRSNIRSIAMGPVELEGKAKVFKELYETPFSGKSCVFYQTIVEELGSAESETPWTLIAEYTTPFPFYLEDETGSVLVDPRGADLRLATVYEIPIEGHKGAQRERIFRGFERFKLDPVQYVGKVQVREISIQPGDSLYVLGSAKDNPLIDAADKQAENILIGQSSGGYFCISGKKEKNLLEDFRIQMYLSFFWGPLLAAVCLWLLLLIYI